MGNNFTTTTASGSGSSLSTTYTILQEEMSVHGYDRDPDNWTADQDSDFARYLRAAVHRFYYPQPTMEGGKSHAWSFLRITTTLSTVADQRVYSTPPDFSNLHGKWTYPSSEAYDDIIVIPNRQMDSLTSQANYTGPPQFVTARPKTTDASAPQLQEFVLEPTPDAVYVLTYQYEVVPSVPTAAAPHIYGGDEHGDTLVAALHAVVSARLDRDAAGDLEQDFQRRLMASINRDRRRAAEVFGYNGDGSTRRMLRRTHYPNSSPTYEGSVYDGS